MMKTFARLVLVASLLFATSALAQTTYVRGLKTPGDAAANPTDAVGSQCLAQGYNGTTWDRIRSGPTNADNIASLSLGASASQSFTLIYDSGGGNWDRWTGAVTQGTAANLKTEVWGGAKGTTSAAVATVNAAGTNNNTLDVTIRDTTGAEMDLFKSADLYTIGTDHGLMILGQDAGAPARYRALKVDSTGSVQVDIESAPTLTVSDGAGAMNVIVDSGTLTGITNSVTVTDGAGAMNVIIDSGTTAVTGTTTPSDAFANPTAATLSFSLLGGWDGTSAWKRLLIGPSNNDGEAVKTSGAYLEVLGYNKVFNGTTWDRQYGNTSGAWVQGPVAEASPAGGNPTRTGAVVEVEGASMTATNQADQDITSIKADPEGRLWTRTDHPNPFSCDLSAASADSAICTDLSTSTTVYITDVFMSNGATAGSIIINSGTGTACGTGTTVRVPATYLPANSGFIYSPSTPIKITWASGLDICADITSMNPYSVQIRGYYYQ